MYGDPNSKLAQMLSSKYPNIPSAEATFLAELKEHKADYASHKAESVYLQVDEPTGANPTTLWFKVDGEINFSQGGVVIENAETSAAPPETFYWFEPIL
jgi:hypothetical protein